MTNQVNHLNFLQRAQLAWGLFNDERVSPWVKRIGPVAIIAYVVSPIDIIPDFFLGPGQIDDLGIIALGMMLLVRMLVGLAPAEVVAEHIARVTGNSHRQEGPDYSHAETIETTGRVHR